MLRVASVSNSDRSTKIRSGAMPSEAFSPRRWNGSGAPTQAASEK